MTEHDALLRSILENPACHTARLVYADWLQENGEPCRAESIRWCVRTGRAFHMVDRKWIYHDRIEPVPPVVWRGLNWHTSLPLPNHYTVRRGFIDEIELPAAAFTEDVARELFSRHPVTKVVLTDREPLLLQFHHPVEEWAENWCWMWRDDEWARRHALRQCLPKPIVGWLYLKRDHRHRSHSARAQQTTCLYPTRDAALAALSDACVNWGRSLVKLPSLAAA